MVQGSTPMFAIKLPFSTDLLASVRVSFEQKNKIVLEKETKDVIMRDNMIGLRLTQKETLMFDPHIYVRMQLHFLTTGGDALPSKPVNIPVYTLLNKKVIQ